MPANRCMERSVSDRRRPASRMHMPRVYSVIAQQCTCLKVDLNLVLPVQAIVVRKSRDASSEQCSSG